MNEATELFIDWMLNFCPSRCMTIKEESVPLENAQNIILDYISPTSDRNKFLPTHEVEALWNSLRDLALSQIDYKTALTEIRNK